MQTLQSGSPNRVSLRVKHQASVCLHPRPCFKASWGSSFQPVLLHQALRHLRHKESALNTILYLNLVLFCLPALVVTLPTQLQPRQSSQLEQPTGAAGSAKSASARISWRSRRSRRLWWSARDRDNSWRRSIRTGRRRNGNPLPQHYNRQVSTHTCDTMICWQAYLGLILIPPISAGRNFLGGNTYPHN